MNDIIKTEVEIAKTLYEIFLQSMESRYRDVLNFIGFLIPALGGFLLVLVKYLNNDITYLQDKIFFVGTIGSNSLLFWGALNCLSASYRYRYLQASVYNIETHFKLNQFIPRTFKPKKIDNNKKRLTFELAPMILQVHILFFLISICALFIIYIFIAPVSLFSFILLHIVLIKLATIFYIGGWYLPNKFNKVLDQMITE